MLLSKYLTACPQKDSGRDNGLNLYFLVGRKAGHCARNPMEYPTRRLKVVAGLGRDPVLPAIENCNSASIFYGQHFKHHFSISLSKAKQSKDQA